MPSRALIIDDDEATRYALALVLRRERFEVIEAADGGAGLDACAAERPDVVFLDLAMPGKGGMEVLEDLTEAEDSPPVIVITGVGTPDSAIRAVQLGAYEYLTKPLDVDRVRVLARRATELRRLRSEIAALQQPPDAVAEPSLIGAHPLMQEVYKAIGRVTATPERTTVLIVGETGTGKELVARAIHRSGSDAAKPFVVVNCGALPAALVESELFGHERGAFTGAVQRRLGKVDLAGEGTLFVDEVASLEPALQQRFLRLLQEREFERVGGGEVLRARSRFVAASNVDLAGEVRVGRFREDLYFRLNVFPIVLPPLRDRLSDLPRLADAMRTRMNARLRRRVAGLAPGALAALEAHRWPGNVRELENTIHSAMLRATGDLIQVEDLPGYLRDSESATQQPRSPFELARRQALTRFERAYLAGLLEECHGHVTEAASRAGMRRQSLQRLIRRHGLEAAVFRASAARPAARAVVAGGGSPVPPLPGKMKAGDG